MSVSDPAGALVWRKSSRSGAGNDCVEIALATTRACVRDSKNPEGGTLRFAATGWARFLVTAKRG